MVARDHLRACPDDELILRLLHMMKLPRTLLILFSCLIWLLPVVTVFSGKLTAVLLVTMFVIIFLKHYQGVFYLFLFSFFAGQGNPHAASKEGILTKIYLLILPIIRLSESFVRHPAFGMTLLLFLWPVLTAWHSITPHQSFFAALNICATMAISALVICSAQSLPSFMRQRQWLGSLVFAILFPVILILWEQWPGGGLIHLVFTHFGGDYTSFMEKILNRSLCIMVLLLWPTMYGLLRINKRMLAHLLPLVMVPAVLLMQSSSAQLALFAGYLVFLSVRLFPRWLPRLLSLTLVVFLMAWPLVFPLLEQAVPQGSAAYEALPRSAQHRLAIWRFTLDHIEEKPWLGWGLDTARAIPGGLEEFAPGMQWLPLHPHNSVLQLLLEEGIVGFVFSLLALGIVLKNWIKLCKKTPLYGALAGAALFSFLIIGFTAFGVWQSWWMASAWLIWMIFEVLRPQSNEPSFSNSNVEMMPTDNEYSTSSGVMTDTEQMT